MPSGKPCRRSAAWCPARYNKRNCSPLAWKSTPRAWRATSNWTQGLVLAEVVSIVLAQRVGRDTAHHLLEQCCKRAVAEQRHLRAVLGDEPKVTLAELSHAELDDLLNPAHYLGQAQVWVERAVAEHNALTV